MITEHRGLGRDNYASMRGALHHSTNNGPNHLRHNMITDLRPYELSYPIQHKYQLAEN